MCLALPAQVVTVDGSSATVTLGGLRKVIDLSLVDGVAPGDYVVVHTGYAISKLDPVEAERTLAILRAAGVGEGGP